ncbi:MAG TPA: DUF5666 domain-containing protein [Thermoanaerobaculia bacterium]|nr:DUF5666 domain-containing protein [Thermoanaerobaculia bacterium]
MGKFARLTMLAVVMSVVFGCSNRSESVTGVNGTTFMSGKVHLSGELSGSRADGIEVRIVGTPLVAVTDADGNFSFGAAPEGTIELSLTRISDGIDALVRVNAQPAVTVELEKKHPKPPKTKTTELEGVVTAVSSSSITLDDARTHAPATAAITSMTVIRKGDHAVTSADIKVGAQVHVKATIDSANKLTATEIIVQDDGKGDDESPDARELEGTITSVSASMITVTDNHTHGNVTAAITAQTIIKKGNTTIAATDLVAGQHVHVRATEAADHSLTATEIKVQQGEGDDDGGQQQKEFEGPISAVSSSSITIRDSRTQTDVTFTISATTVIRKGQKQLTPGDLKAGDRVHIKATADSGTTLTATEIVLQAQSRDGDED